MEFIFIVQVIDFKFLQVIRGLGSPIPLDTLDGGRGDKDKKQGWHQLTVGLGEIIQFC